MALFSSTHTGRNGSNYPGGGRGGPGSSPSHYSSGTYNNRSRRGDVICDFCHIRGHTRNACYKLNGYPADYKPKKRFGAENQSTRDTSGSGGDKSSKVNGGTAGGTASSSVNFAGTSKLQQGGELSQDSNDMIPGLPQFTKDQYSKILQLLDSNESKHSAMAVGMIKSDDARDVSHYDDTKVHLPTGRLANVHHIGSSSAPSQTREIIGVDTKHISRQPVATNVTQHKTLTASIWHMRLGHIPAAPQLQSSTESTSTSTVVVPTSPSVESCSSSSSSTHPVSSASPSHVSVPEVRRSSRPHKPPVWMSDYISKGHVVAGDIVIVLVYVDDLLVTGSSVQLITQTRNDLKLQFKMKDLGELKFFLGIEFARSKKGIVMS
uniref:Reverse transcriptase Ty1/copia-type domain-containing protein n=1 Tax=Solanum lycopersicum TaxID=4081 RepID=A0A3Q7IUE9_SOLLC